MIWIFAAICTIIGAVAGLVIGHWVGALVGGFAGFGASVVVLMLVDYVDVLLTEHYTTRR
jgi:purine-cytosine permease-like protein